MHFIKLLQFYNCIGFTQFLSTQLCTNQFFLANLSQYFSLSLSKPTPSMCCISHILLTTDFHFSSDFHEKRIIILNLCLGIQMFSCQNYTSAIHKVHYCKLTTNYIVTLGRFLRTGNCYTSLLAKGPKHRVIF